MAKEKPCIISRVYGIYHPVTKKYFYVGITTGTLKRRLYQHIYMSTKKESFDLKNQIIQDIIKLGLYPKIKQLKKCNGYLEALLSEKYWTAKIKERGNNLSSGFSDKRVTVKKELYKSMYI